MKTLKKTLCLVLAVVMVVGTLAITANATDFKDDKNVTTEYKKAVELITAKKIMNGIGDNKFDPQGTLTREMAAQIVAVVALGYDGWKTLSGTKSTFDDVADGHWAVPSIEYCRTAKITAGVGNNNFGPKQVLNGDQFERMLLVALGYDYEKENIDATTWSSATQTLAYQTGLLSGMKSDFVATNPITREQACQLAYNALFAEMVEYSGGVKVPTEYGDITVGAVRNGAGMWIATKVQNIALDNGAGAKLTTNPAKNAGTQKPYYPGGTTDKLGRPTHKFENNSNTDAIVTVTDKPVATYTDSFTKEAWDKLVEANGFSGAITVYYNGASLGSFTTGTDSWNPNKSYDTGAGDKLYAGSDKKAINGYYVEVYATGDHKATIVITEPYFAQITEVKATEGTTAGSVKVKVYEYENQIELTVTDDLTKTDDIYEKLKGYAKDDYLVVYAKGGWHADGTKGANYIIDIADVTTVSGTVTQITKGLTVGWKNNESVIYIDGKSYSVNSEWTNKVDQPDATNNTNIKVQDKGTLYLAPNGKAIGWIAEAAAKSPDPVMYVLNVYSSLVDGKIKTMADGIMPDGSTVTVAVAAGVSSTSDEKQAYTYAVNSTTNEYTFVAAVNGDTSGGGANRNSLTGDRNAVKLATNTLAVGTLQLTLCQTNQTTFTFRPDVKFIYIDSNKKVTVKEGRPSVQQGAADMYFVVGKYDANTPDNTIYAVYVNAAEKTNTTTTSSDILFVVDTVKAKNDYIINDAKTTIYTYDAYVNGEKTSIESRQGSVTTGFYGTMKDADGYYIIGTQAEGTNAQMNGGDGTAPNKVFTGITSGNTGYNTTTKVLTYTSGTLDLSSAKMVNLTNVTTSAADALNTSGKTIWVLGSDTTKTAYYVYIIG